MSDSPGKTAGPESPPFRSASRERGELRAKIAGLKDGQTVAVVGLQFGLNVPQSYEKAYDQIIRMMEMSVDEIVLTGSQFACFVMDDWDWKDQWSASNATYLAKK